MNSTLLKQYRHDDPGGGSGSGAGPARLELEPRFVDVAIKRWQAFSRKDAIHAETDLTFDEVASDRTAAPAVGTGEEHEAVSG